MFTDEALCMNFSPIDMNSYLFWCAYISSTALSIMNSLVSKTGGALVDEATEHVKLLQTEYVPVTLIH
jgi:hypothetical protein